MLLLSTLRDILIFRNVNKKIRRKRELKERKTNKRKKATLILPP